MRGPTHSWNAPFSRRIRDARGDLRLARGDLALPRLQHLTHHDMLHLVRLDPRALERRLDGDCAQLRGGEGGQAAAELADGGAGSTEDHGVGH